MILALLYSLVWLHSSGIYSESLAPLFHVFDAAHSISVRLYSSGVDSEVLAPPYPDFGPTHSLPARLCSSGVYSELLAPSYPDFGVAHSLPTRLRSSGELLRGSGAGLPRFWCRSFSSSAANGVVQAPVLCFLHRNRFSGADSFFQCRLSL